MSFCTTAGEAFTDQGVPFEIPLVTTCFTDHGNILTVYRYSIFDNFPVIKTCSKEY